VIKMPQLGTCKQTNRPCDGICIICPATRTRWKLNEGKFHDMQTLHRDGHGATYGTVFFQDAKYEGRPPYANFKCINYQSPQK